MGFVYIIWFAMCYAAFLILELLQQGWLANYGVIFVKNMKKICKGFIIISLIVMAVFEILRML